VKIVFPLEYLSTFFPDLADLRSKPEKLKSEIADYYTYGSIEPEVEVKDESLVIDVDTHSIEDFQSRYDRGVELAEQGKYTEAREIFEELLEDHPGVSDLHRMHAQTFFEEGQAEKALDHVIPALRWDPNNVHALTLAGNIFLQGKNDSDTAKTFYDRAAEIAPDNHLVLNNLGGMMLKTGRSEEGKRYLKKALEAKDDYPNTHYGLALAYKHEGHLQEGFKHAIAGIKCAGRQGEMKSRLEQIADNIAEEYEESEDLEPMVEGYAKDLEERGGKAVRMVPEEGTDNPASLQLAANYDRDVHRVVYDPSKEHRAHLIMHELTHLDFILQAREDSWNELFLTRDEHRQTFVDDNRSKIEEMKSLGLEGMQLEGMIDQLFRGLNDQVYNAPVDLFIEQHLHEEFPELRPVQYASLKDLLGTYIEGATNEMKEIAPRRVWASNVALNLTHAYQFRDLYGLDYEMDFRAPRQLRNKAQRFYEEYEEIEEAGRIPGEEYELIEDWAARLGVGDYHELAKEEEHRDISENGEDPQNNSSEKSEEGQKDPNDVLDEIEKDPYDLEEEAKSNSDGTQISFEDNPAGSMAVTMHLVDALQYYEDKDEEEIQSVAFEIAMLGRQGINPMNTDKRYSLRSVPNREFSPLQLLAYMFAGFQKIDDSLDLQLDFEDEYQQALAMAKGRE
jgi:Tfp pilus assembly protein PilF